MSACPFVHELGQVVSVGSLRRAYILLLETTQQLYYGGDWWKRRFHSSPLSLLCVVTILVFLVHAYFTHNGKCDHRNPEITVLGLWVVSTKFENGAMSQCRALPGCQGSRLKEEVCDQMSVCASMFKHA